MTASATRRACAQPSELVTTADRSTGRPAADEAAIFRNDARRARGRDKPFRLTVIRPS